MLSDFKGGNVTSGVADGVAEGLAETAGVPEAAGAVLGITVGAVVFTGLTFAFVTLTLQTRVNFFFSLFYKITEILVLQNYTILLSTHSSHVHMAHY